jgi:hypothetical protein
MDIMPSNTGQPSAQYVQTLQNKSGRVTGDFFRGIRQVHVPGVDSAFQNEYQDIPGGKDGQCVGLTTLPP